MVIIIGSGVSGSMLAYELSLNNIPVTIIEKGPYIKPEDAFKYYDTVDKDTILLKTSCVGGSSLVSAGNMVPVLIDELKELDVNIDDEINYVTTLLNISSLPDSHFGNGTKLIMESAKNMGIDIQKMPKCIDKSCVPCGNCSFGCIQNAKWSSIDFINDAVENGATLLDNTEVIELISENNSIKGVKIKNDMGTSNLYSDVVILAAGAIGSALLLQKSNISAGKTFFMDPFVTVGGVIKDINFNQEVQMNALIKFEHFIISPHFSGLLYDQLKDKGFNEGDIIGLMVKFSDELNGFISENFIVKNNTIQDIQYLSEGTTIAGTILENIGVDPNTIVSTPLRGAHPGGTARIGDIVDNNLETSISGLFVSDASVLPNAPGAPPMLTILAISKRLADYLIFNFDLK